MELTIQIVAYKTDNMSNRNWEFGTSSHVHGNTGSDSLSSDDRCHNTPTDTKNEDEQIEELINIVGLMTMATGCHAVQRLDRQPMYTSILTGDKWIRELVADDWRCYNSLRMHSNVF